jgi:hypothetical protein
LPPPSFTLHLAVDALGLGYTLPTTGRVRDFHPLDCAHAGRTKTKALPVYFQQQSLFHKSNRQYTCSYLLNIYLVNT